MSENDTCINLSSLSHFIDNIMLDLDNMLKITQGHPVHLTLENPTHLHIVISFCLTTLGHYLKSFSILLESLDSELKTT